MRGHQLFIPGKALSTEAQPEYGTDMRAIETAFNALPTPPGAHAGFTRVSKYQVLAKTHRDAYVLNVLHPRFPAYAWDRNKGYGTPAHLAALAEHGPCAEHRRTFAPVAAQWMPSGMNDVQT